MDETKKEELKSKILEILARDNARVEKAEEIMAAIGEISGCEEEEKEEEKEEESEE